MNNAMAGVGGNGAGGGVVRWVGLQSLVQQAMEKQQQEEEEATEDHLKKMTWNEPIIVMVMAPDGANDR